MGRGLPIVILLVTRAGTVRGAAVAVVASVTVSIAHAMWGMMGFQYNILVGLVDLRLVSTKLRYIVKLSVSIGEYTCNNSRLRIGWTAIQIIISNMKLQLFILLLVVHCLAESGESDDA
jgi:hypothetical protein